MKRIAITTALLALTAAASTAALASTSCNVPKEKWMPEAEFKKNVEAQGYQIKKFKISDGCYEIYGTDKNGKKVEIYFDPSNAAVVKKSS